MPGWLTNGVFQLNTATGAETVNLDTNKAAGSNPQTGDMTLVQLATQALFLSNNASKTTVAGTRYYVQYPVGFAQTVTGVQVLMGSTGGTDKFIAELHDSAGNLVATSATAGQTTGAAGTVMQLAFTATYTVAPGTYYLAIQSNGTTDHPAVYNAPSLPLNTGSATGTFGTGAAITPPTTYTAALGPVASLY